MYNLLLDDDLLIFSLLVSLILNQIKQINWIPTIWFCFKQLFTNIFLCLILNILYTWVDEIFE